MSEMADRASLSACGVEKEPDTSAALVRILRTDCVGVISTSNKISNLNNYTSKKPVKSAFSLLLAF